MKKKILAILACLSLIASGMAIAKVYSRGATSLTGGATGALDAYDGTDLQDLDRATVVTATTKYEYVLDVDSAASESSPEVIAPDTNAGNKRWIKVSPALKVSIANTANPPTNAELVAAFGAAATVGKGYTAILNDNNGGTAEYVCWSDGTNWFYAAGTKAVD